ncbi:uncharacterized protein BT62DRAFT_1081553 [Guyanagaster necrorhizus]|uniref:Uncharacterized protein n=1 Tax=Guyanagaster necrorhizus TaxID=856835 RepID=A0A9P8AL94_9AGAR|nr:uncharacterized protein BT62DRAFT_1081553 [Guyanagaster necrorhizus MCA 3950]KAG7439489.1 hypothetical protein BT62DRAFT_1081553 [Guyanagaster necrorhizus MCA 3950]
MAFRRAFHPKGSHPPPEDVFACIGKRSQRLFIYAKAYPQDEAPGSVVDQCGNLLRNIEDGRHSMATRSQRVGPFWGFSVFQNGSDLSRTDLSGVLGHNPHHVRGLLMYHPSLAQFLISPKPWPSLSARTIICLISRDCICHRSITIITLQKDTFLGPDQCTFSPTAADMRPKSSVDGAPEERLQTLGGASTSIIL